MAEYTLPKGFKLDPVEPAPAAAPAEEQYTLPKGFKLDAPAAPTPAPVAPAPQAEPSASTELFPDPVEPEVPGAVGTFVRSATNAAFGEGSAESMLTGRDPDQPVHRTINSALKAAGTDPKTGLPTGSFDVKKSKVYRDAEIERQKEITAAGEDAHRGAAQAGEILGEVAPYLVPIPGVASARLATRLGAEALRAGTVAGVKSDAEVGSTEWLADVGIATATGPMAELSVVPVKHLTKFITSKVVKFPIRRLQAFERTMKVSAMIVKLAGKEMPEMAMKTALGDKWAGKIINFSKKIDDGIVNKLTVSKTPRTKAGQFVKKGAMYSTKKELGKLAAQAWTATGGITTPTVGLILTPLLASLTGSDRDVSMGEYVGALKDFGYGHGAGLLAGVLSDPKAVLGMLRKTRYAPAIASAIKSKSKDAYRAAMIHLSQQDDVQRLLLGDRMVDRLKNPDKTESETTTSEDLFPDEDK